MEGAQLETHANSGGFTIADNIFAFNDDDTEVAEAKLKDELDLKIGGDQHTFLAQALHPEGPHATFLDKAFPSTLTRADEADGLLQANNLKSGPASVHMDEAVALALQSENERSDEQIALSEAKRVFEQAMKSSSSGKAWNLVHAVFEEHKKLPSLRGFAPIGTDDMLFIAERFAEAQAEFRRDEKHIHVDIGYHYTKSENLECIKSNGLLTKGERLAQGVAINYNGSTWGDGVYTGNNPHAYRRFGDIGLLVARLRGDQKRAVRRGHGFDGDTAIAHAGSSKEMVILGRSCQCIPLVQFSHTAEEAAVLDCHFRLQAIVDNFFNDGVPTPLSTVALQVRSAGKRPAPLRSYARKKARHITDPQIGRLESSPFQSETYLRAAFPFGGRQEIMRILSYTKDVLACDTFDTFVIVYGFSPTDCGYTRAHRIEYLPDTPPSRAILERLKYAFCSGLTDQLTWLLIPHRTNPHLPYPSYASICGEALDSVGIPAAAKCDVSSNCVAKKTLHRNNDVLTVPKQEGVVAGAAASGLFATVSIPVPATVARDGFRIVTLPAVLQEICLNNGVIELGRLMKLFGIKRTSSLDRQSKFREVTTDLCTCKRDSWGGRILVLKQQYSNMD